MPLYLALFYFEECLRLQDYNYMMHAIANHNPKELPKYYLSTNNPSKGYNKDVVKKDIETLKRLASK